MHHSRSRSYEDPHIHVPYDTLDKYLGFIRERRLNLEIYFGSTSVDRITKQDIVALRNKLDYGPSLTVHAPFMDLSPGAVDEKVRAITVQRFSDVLDFSGVLQPGVIVFHSGYDRWRYDHRVDIWLDGSLRTWGVLNRRAADMGIRIAIENIFEDDPENLRLLAREMDSDNFGICFDTGHFNLFSKLPLREWLGLIRDYIRELHLHDNSRFRDDHLPIGDGDFDFRTLFSELQDIDCVYTIEAHSMKDVVTSMERLKGYLT